MRKTIRPNKLNHKPQGVCEENNKEKELEGKKTTARKNILRLKDLIWKPVEEQYHDQFKRNLLHGSFKA